MHEHDPPSNHLFGILVFQVLFIHSTHTILLSSYAFCCMYDAWLSQGSYETNISLKGKKMHKAIYTVQLHQVLSRVQHLKEKMKENLKAYKDKAFQTALNQVRGTLAQVAKRTSTDNILKR